MIGANRISKKFIDFMFLINGKSFYVHMAHRLDPKISRVKDPKIVWICKCYEDNRILTIECKTADEAIKKIVMALEQ